MKKRLIAGALCAVLLLAAGCRQESPPASSGTPAGSSASSGAPADGSTDGTAGFTDPASSTLPDSSTPGSAAPGKTTRPKTPAGSGSVTTATTAGTGKKTPVAVEKVLKPLTASDDAQFWGNPDRGFRSNISGVGVHTIAEQKDMAAYCKELVMKTIGQNKNYPGDDTMVMQNYFYLYAYNNGDISARGLEGIKTFLRVQAEMGIKSQPRFCYMTSMPDPDHEASQETMLRHIDQLAPVIKEMKDTIQAFPICFIGAWGEWHSDGLKYPIDKKVICKAVMEKLVIPNGLYGLIRLPEYKNLMKGETWYNRLGIENDAVFGKVPYGYGNADGGTGGLEDGTDQWLQLIKEAAYTPQDGEIYWNSWFPENDAWVDGKRCVLQFSEHRFSTLSIMHSYLDWGRKETSEIGKWKKIAMTEDWLKKNGVLYDANWFKDKNGKAVSRNLFEFVRDHLGYRIVGQSLKITGDSKPSAPIQVAMSLQNRGFAAAFNLESGFAILDSQNKVVSTVKCGNPAAWYNRNPDNYSDTKQLTHTLSAKMKLPGRAGRYKLAFYLKNSLNRYARVSIDAAVVNGYHILHEFDVA